MAKTGNGRLLVLFTSHRARDRGLGIVSKRPQLASFKRSVGYGVFEVTPEEYDRLRQSLKKGQFRKFKDGPDLMKAWSFGGTTMAKKSKNTGKIIGGLLLVGASVTGYLLYRQATGAGTSGMRGYGLKDVNRRRGVKTYADRYNMKAEIYRDLMGKSPFRSAPVALGAVSKNRTWPGNRVMGVLR